MSDHGTENDTDSAEEECCGDPATILFVSHIVKQESKRLPDRDRVRVTDINVLLGGQGPVMVLAAPARTDQAERVPEVKRPSL